MRELIANDQKIQRAHVGRPELCVRHSHGRFRSGDERDAIIVRHARQPQRLELVVQGRADDATRSLPWMPATARLVRIS